MVIINEMLHGKVRFYIPVCTGSSIWLCHMQYHKFTTGYIISLMIHVRVIATTYKNAIEEQICPYSMRSTVPQYQSIVCYSNDMWTSGRLVLPTTRLFFFFDSLFILRTEKNHRSSPFVLVLTCAFPSQRSVMRKFFPYHDVKMTKKIQF